MATKRPANLILPRHKRLLYGVAAAVALLFVLSLVAGLFADYLWFDALGYSSVFATELWTKVLLGLGVLVVTAGWLAGHVILATRLSPGYHLQVKGLKWTVSASQIRRWLYIAGGIFGAVLGAGFARGAAGQWYEVLQFLHRAPFGWADPVLENDAQVYVFVLPILGSLKSYVMAMAVLGAIGAAAAYFLNGAIGWQYARMTRAATVHLASLVAMVLLAAFLMVASVAAAAVVLAAGVRMMPKLAGGAVAVLILAHVVAAWAYPVVRQRFDVEPNELARETPYLAHNIEATRFAFGLSDVQVQEFPAKGAITRASLQEARGTISNIRLWDYRALRDTYNEIQGLRTYYVFPKIDTDRYHVGDDYRQVSLAVRELRSEALQQQSRTWVNLHLLYTHGYGLCMSPVNAVTESGGPELWIRDIPPKASVPIDVSDASIYFGELTDDYVFVRTRQDEFHYPVGDENVYTGRLSAASAASRRSWNSTTRPTRWSPTAISSGSSTPTPARAGSRTRRPSSSASTAAPPTTSATPSR